MSVGAGFGLLSSFRRCTAFHPKSLMISVWIQKRFIKLHQNLLSRPKPLCLSAIKQENDAAGKNVTLIFISPSAFLKCLLVADSLSIRHASCILHWLGNTWRFFSYHFGDSILAELFNWSGQIMTKKCRFSTRCLPPKRNPVMKRTFALWYWMKKKFLSTGVNILVCISKHALCARQGI